MSQKVFAAHKLKLDRPQKLSPTSRPVEQPQVARGRCWLTNPLATARQANGSISMPIKIRQMVAIAATAGVAVVVATAVAVTISHIAMLAQSADL